MSFYKSVFVLFLLLFVAVPPYVSWSQENVMKIGSETFDKFERTIVDFKHDAHAEIIDCENCHHDFDKYYNNKGPLEVKCSECHLLTFKNGENRYFLRLAIHKNCKTCHSNMISKGQKSGPIVCGECHL